MPTINDYQRMISVYVQRRKDYNASINRKLNIWRCGIQRINRRNEKINSVIDNTNDYFQVDISSESFNRKVTLARHFYYKYALESKVANGRYISEAIKRGSREAAKRRMELTRSFKNNQKKKKQYHEFKDFMDEKLKTKAT